MTRAGWPLFRELRGRYVELLHPLISRGGQQFERGQIMRVFGTWRGYVHLESITTPVKGLRGVGLSSLKLLEVSCTCCPLGGVYGGFGSDGPRRLTCPKACACHD